MYAIIYYMYMYVTICMTKWYSGIVQNYFNRTVDKGKNKHSADKSWWQRRLSIIHVHIDVDIDVKRFDYFADLPGVNRFSSLAEGKYMLFVQSPLRVVYICE